MLFERNNDKAKVGEVDVIRVQSDAIYDLYIVRRCVVVLLLFRLYFVLYKSIVFNRNSITHEQQKNEKTLASSFTCAQQTFRYYCYWKCSICGLKCLRTSIFWSIFILFSSWILFSMYILSIDSAEMFLCFRPAASYFVVLTSQFHLIIKFNAPNKCFLRTIQSQLEFQLNFYAFVPKK